MSDTERALAAEERLNAMLEMCDRMISAIDAVGNRLNRIETKIDEIPQRWGLTPRWKRHGYRLDGTPREAYSQAITKLD